jgi:hypothetical protein
MPYLWQGALSIVSQTLLVMGATMSVSLSSILATLVPSLDTIDAIINDVVMEIERYAHLAPSISLSSADEHSWAWRDDYSPFVYQHAKTRESHHHLTSRLTNHAPHDEILTTNTKIRMRKREHAFTRHSAAPEFLNPKGRTARDAADTRYTTY